MEINDSHRSSDSGCAVSSVVEHFLDTEGVRGSNPLSRTIFNVLNHRNVKYPITSIKSDSDGAYGTWVSIGFRFKKRQVRVLHIVGGSAPGPANGKMAPMPIYFECDDQALSCYEGAEKILLRDSSLTLVLNRTGQQCLELPKKLEFVPPKGSRNFKKAVTAFKKMQTLTSGEIIQVT